MKFEWIWSIERSTLGCCLFNSLRSFDVMCCVYTTENVCTKMTRVERTRETICKSSLYTIEWDRSCLTDTVAQLWTVSINNDFVTCVTHTRINTRKPHNNTQTFLWFFSIVLTHYALFTYQTTKNITKLDSFAIGIKTGGFVVYLNVCTRFL